jgi:hypothetical protein
MDCGVCLRGRMAPFALVAGREIASEVTSPGGYPLQRHRGGSFNDFVRGPLSELLPIHLGVYPHDPSTTRFRGSDPRSCRRPILAVIECPAKSLNTQVIAVQPVSCQ